MENFDFGKFVGALGSFVGTAFGGNPQGSVGATQGANIGANYSQPTGGGGYSLPPAKGENSMMLMLLGLGALAMFGGRR